MKQKRLFEDPEVCDKIPLDVARAKGDKNIVFLTSLWFNIVVAVGNVRLEKLHCKDIDIVGVALLIAMRRQLTIICQPFRTEFKVIC